MSGGDTCRIKVVCRVRPLNEKEVASGSTLCVEFPGENVVAIGQRHFTYDHVLRPQCTQAEVYGLSAKQLVQDVLTGYNATIFAYGQTSSGKTHTMEGELGSDTSQGIIPRIVQDMFEHIYSMDDNLEIHLKVSYFEIYMERIRDLLDVTKFNLTIGETKLRVPYVKGVTERFVTSPEEVFAVIEDGKANRHVSVTNMNAHSSRSHAVFLLSVKQENKETRKTITGKLYLVDLAGSEKVEKTNAQGLTLDEAKTINKSLLSLSNVISALADGNRSFVPYRDSKLTRVLQESLGGNARTTLVICCSPSSTNASETKGTLLFGDRAKTVKNSVAVNVELTAEEWRRRYEKEREGHARLKALLRIYEAELARWRAGEAVPEDEWASVAKQQRGSHVASSSADDSFSSPPSTRPPSNTTLAFEEHDKLCQQLEEKEEELQLQTELVERLVLQLQEMEEALSATQLEASTLRKQIAVIEAEMVNSQEEVHEVMQALEELAVSYDSKDKEIQAAVSEKQLLAEEMEQLKHITEDRLRELSLLQEASQSQRRKNHERLSSLLRDLSEVGAVLGAKQADRWAQDFGRDISDEDFTRARIHLSNLRCEARTVTERRDVLERAERDARERAQAAMKELASSRLKVSQYETLNESLQSGLREYEVKKEELELALSRLHEELLVLRTQEQLLLAPQGQREQEEAGPPLSGDEMRRAFDEQLQQQRSGQRLAVDALRGEISTKEEQITHIAEEYQAQALVVETLRGELRQLRRRYQEERAGYAQTRLAARVRDHVRQDLGGLTDTVARELSRLWQLREAYMQRMARRIKGKGSEVEGAGHDSPEYREIVFLEKNLEELTRAHKKLTSENAEMQRDIPRLKAVIGSKSKRIGELEHLLRETRHEMDLLVVDNKKLEQSFMARLKEKEREIQYGRSARRQGGPQLARPVPRRIVESSLSREALLAGAGVAVIGQHKRRLQIGSDGESSGVTDISSSESSLSSAQPS